MRCSIAISYLLALNAIASPIENAPETDLERRQGLGDSILFDIIYYMIKDNLPSIFAQPPACDTYFEGNYYLKLGQAKNGLYHSTCWTNSSSSTTTFTQANVDTSHCLTNLHYVQGDVCISTKGSSCDNGYSGAAGQVANLRELILAKGVANYEKISGAESEALQGAAGALLGHVVDTHAGANPIFIATTDKKGTQITSDFAQMGIDWPGQDGC